MSSGFNDRIFLLMPISVVAHVGGLWGSVYAGAGYSPVALEAAIENAARCAASAFSLNQ